MKKIVVCAICVGFTVQAEASIEAYLRAAATGAWTNSDFNVEGTAKINGVDRDLSVIKHKEHSIRNIGARVAVGLQTKLDYDWFFGGEFNYFFDRAKHDHDFIDGVDGFDIGFNNDKRISYVNIKHKDEFGFSFKFGKEFIGHDVYGICGVLSKRVEFKYALDHEFPGILATADLITDSKKRMWGMVFGLGASRKINKNLSCSLEYRYKIYNTSTETVDWIDATKTFFDKTPPDEYYDKTPRKFKIKSDNHELSIGFTLNV